MNPELFIPVGIPGAGKSTYIDKYKKDTHTILCLDDFRLAAGSTFNPNIDKLLQGMYELVGRAIMIRGQNIALDSTNVSYYITKRWIDYAKEYNYDTTIVLMNIDMETCEKRQTKNVGTEKMYRFANQMQDLTYRIHELGADKILEVDKEGELKRWD